MTMLQELARPVQRLENSTAQASDTERGPCRGQGLNHHRLHMVVDSSISWFIQREGGAGPIENCRRPPPLARALRERCRGLPHCSHRAYKGMGSREWKNIGRCTTRVIVMLALLNEIAEVRCNATPNWADEA